MSAVSAPAQRATDIAVIGIAGRFPEAGDAEQFWLNLREGRESVRTASPGELEAAGVTPGEHQDPRYVPAVAAAPDIESFDASLFRYTPREAAHTDPQIRMFLEVTHAALENAGYDPFGQLESVAVYGSAGTNRYVDMYLGNGRDESSSSSMAVSSLNNTDYVASTAAYKLNLHGAAITLSTACSSSLVGLHLACQALRHGECEMAVVGGVDVEFPLGHGYRWDDGGPVSRSGHVRPFGADADGTVFGSGAGAVVLKPLPTALADGDYVWAVVRGSAVNNDGADKAGFTAPAISGQAAMLVEALAMAGVSPRDLDYIEAHATGTLLGDPIEVAALTRAFRALADADLAPGGCALGSVKGNVGHLGHAAGIASLIKVIMALDRQELPASINASEANGRLGLDDSPFRLARELEPWRRREDRARIAGVSSFGIGGTNAHAVLAEAAQTAATAEPVLPQLVVWSGRSDEAADAYRPKLATHLGWRGAELGLSAVASTLQVGRRHYPKRRAFVTPDLTSAVAALELTPGAPTVHRTPDGPPRDVVFCFPGQGAQHARMAYELYGALPAFTSAMDECLQLFAEHGLQVSAPWRDADDEALTDTALAQPLLFATEWSLAQQWESWGVRPHAVCAHSVGEFAAACVAGVMDLADAVGLVAARARASVGAPPGRMLAVRAAPDALGELPDGVHIAVVNGPRQTVVAGVQADVEAYALRLKEQRVSSRLLATARAFHTPLMAGAAEHFGLSVADVALHPPQLPIYSGAVGGLLGEQATEPGFWADQLRCPVRFDRVLDALAGAPRLLVEVGPGATLTSLARQHPAGETWTSATTLPPPGGDDQLRHALDAVAQVWTAGQDVDWQQVRAGGAVRRVPLPGYQYQRSRHWVDPAPKTPARPVDSPVVSPLAATPAQPELAPTAPPPDSPFSTVRWRRVAPDRAPAARRGSAVLFLPEQARQRTALVLAVQQAGLRPILVRAGQGWSVDGAGYRVRPDSPSDARQVLADLASRGVPVDVLVSGFGLDPWPEATGATIAEQQALGVGSLVALAQAATHAPTGVRLAVVLSGSVDVTGSEPLHPAKAMLHGFVRSLAAEHPDLGCRIVDVGPHVPDAALADQLRRTEVFDAIALRGTGAWQRIEEPFEATRSLGALRPRGVYVLTGGLGGLGRVVARGLAATGLAPRLVLVGRTVPDAGDAFLAELEQLGAEVRVVPADVADARAVRRVLDVAAAHYGVVNGVLHLAGIPGDGMIAFRSQDDVAAVLAPKVGGTLALAGACAGRAALDFFVTFSSRSAVDGLIGSADYAAANAFQDATAVALSRQGVPALSIGWPSWAEVGMAVDRDERLEPWVVEVGPDTPLLDEHRIDGLPVMPGTGHLDLAVRALRERVPGAAGAAVELRDVLYEQVMAAHGRRRIEVRFTPAGAGWGFEIWSRSAVAAGPAVSETAVRHVRGRAALLDVSAPAVEVEALLARFPTVDPDADAETVRLFTLGPRWDTVTATRVGPAEGEKLVELQLPADFSHEAEQHALHPTLLDSATASARNSTESPHLPFLIERLVVYADLPARVVSHIRRRRAADGLISADVDLLARDGRVLAQLGGYTMRRIGDAGFLGGDGGSTSALDDPEFGVPPLTGVGLLLDLLPLAGEVDHVVVRPFRSGRPVPLEAAPSTRPPAPIVAPVAQPAARSAARPAAHSAAQRPPAAVTPVPTALDEADVAARLMAIWAEAIGSSRIGVDEDFFELGGNSLTAVGLMSTVRQEFAVELSIAALFDFPTIASLAKAILEQLRSSP